MIDSALIRIMGFRISEDKGRLLENIVFLQLKMRGEEIYFHKEQKECDFLVRKDHRITQAIQVTTQLSDENVRDREMSGLIEAMHVHGLQEGLILTENEEETLQIEDFQIKVLPIWKWLLSFQCENGI